MHRLISALGIGFLSAALCLGQPAPKAHMFHGKVEAVDEATKSLKVNGEKVEGWMEAMTMNYKVDDPAVLKKVKAGDQIMATVYDGDYSLHKVQIVAKNGEDSAPKK